MTEQQKIKCPKCGELISIDDVLTHQVEEKIQKKIREENRVKEAIKAGREISINQKIEFVIHNMDGRIADSDSHGRDPYPPRG